MYPVYPNSGFGKKSYVVLSLNIQVYTQKIMNI
jgi:hypothetical protein